MTRFVAKLEKDDINVSKIHPLREALFLVAGVTGGALILFVFFTLIVEFGAPLIPPRLEYRLFKNWCGIEENSLDPERIEMTERAKRVLNRLLPHWQEAPFPIGIAIQPSNEINAFAMPGGTILVTEALMENVSTDEELAFVIGHELGHFANRDHLRGLGRSVSIALINMTLQATGVPTAALTIIDHVDQAASLSMDRQQEIAADAFGLDLLVKAYDNPAGGSAFLNRLATGSSSRIWLGYLKTHPAAEDRIDALTGTRPGAR